MRKYSIILAFAAMAAAASSCAEKVLDASPAPAEGMRNIEIAVSMDETKAVLDGKSVIWADGDSVAVFDGINESANVFTVSGVSGKTAWISGSIADGATALQAVYPFSAALSSKVDTMTFNLDQPQVIPAGSNIDPKALVSVAKAAVGASMSFKNAVSLVKFEITQDNVESVLFLSNNSEKFTGNATACFDGAALAVEGGSGHRMKIVPEGESFAKGTYYATVLPATIEGGITFVSGTKEAKTFRKTTKSVSFALNGGVNFGDIKGTETLPLTIATKADLLAWAENTTLYVNADTVRLSADIDMEGAEWNPVKDNCCSFDGQGHSIYNIVIKTNENNRTGFLGYVSAGFVLKNLKLGYDPAKSGYDGTSKITVTTATGDSQVGSFVACVTKNASSLENLVNYIPISVETSTALTASFRMGGIVGVLDSGSAASVKSCQNYGAINMNHSAAITSAQYFGGITGLVAGNDCSVENCKNFGDIEGAATTVIKGKCFIGGMVGRIGANSFSLTIKDCSNEGNLNVTMNNKASNFPLIGGILGADNAADTLHTKVTVLNCSNKGKISCKNQTAGCCVGGIVGYMVANSLIDGCTNDGLIEKSGNMGDNSYFGGIVGRSLDSSKNGWVCNCTNNGKVYEVAQTSKKQIFYGGIIGIAYTNLKNCTNNAEVLSVGTDDFAGVVGGIAGAHGNDCAMINCKNYGNVTLSTEGATVNTKAGCGGLVGRHNNIETHTFEGCIVDCTVTTPKAELAGMIIGSYTDGLTPVVEFGTAASPVKVAGTINGTPITAENYNNYLNGATNANATFHAEFLTK